MANGGILPALAGRGDAIFADRLNHASLVDGMLLSRAGIHRYPHADMAALEALLAASPARRKLIVTDAVFSMDGDVAPLAELLALAVRHDAWLVVDDATASACSDRKAAVRSPRRASAPTPRPGASCSSARSARRRAWPEPSSPATPT